MITKYKSIGIKEPDYVALAEKKEALERIIGKRLDWAEFLLLLADLKSISQIVGYPVAELHDSEGEEPMPEQLEEFESFDLATPEQIEEIINRAADRIIMELKGSEG